MMETEWLFAPFMRQSGERAGKWKSRLRLTFPKRDLRLRVSLGTEVLDSIEPVHGMFLDPDFTAAIIALFSDLNQATRQVSEAAAVRGRVFPRKATLGLLHTIALGHARRLSTWVDCGRDRGGKLRFCLRRGRVLRAPRPAVDALWIGVARPGRAERVIPIALAKLPLLVRLIAFWNGGHANEIEQVLRDSDCQAFLEAVAAVGGFSDEKPIHYLPTQRKDAALCVTHLGHAGLVIDGGGKRVLIDPWLFPDEPEFCRHPLSIAELGPIDAIFFTHHHGDHLDIASLFWLPHDVPIFVPKLPDGELAPPIARFLQTLGFSYVREFSAGDRVGWGGLSVEAVPFFGEGSDRLGFGATCYLISCRGASVLVHADASPDSSGRSLIESGYLRRLVLKYGRIGTVFGTWWQHRQFLFQLSPLAVACPGIAPDQWLDGTENCDCSGRFLRKLAREAGAELFLFYAEQGRELFLPPALRSVYVPTTSLLWKSRRTMGDVLRRAGVEVRDAVPGSRVILAQNAKPVFRRGLRLVP